MMQKITRGELNWVIGALNTDIAALSTDMEKMERDSPLRQLANTMIEGRTALKNKLMDIYMNPNAKTIGIKEI